jgi:hypothetical protein
MRTVLLVGALGIAMHAYAADKPFDPRVCVVANQMDYQQSLSLPANVDLVRRVNMLPYTAQSAEGICRVNYSAPPGRLPVYAETVFRQNLGFLRKIPGGVFKHAEKLSVVGKIVKTPVRSGLFYNIEARF